MMNLEKKVLKFGSYSAITLVVMTIITWVFAMIAVPPAGPYCPGDCMSYPFSDLLSYYPRDYYWMFLAVLQLFAYLVFVVSVHFTTRAENKLYSFLSVAFALIASSVLLIAYFTQFAVIPISMMKGETEGIALLSQYNGHGLFIAMEELGYITMSISFFFMAFAFSFVIPLEKALRVILISTLLLTLVSFILYTTKYGLDRSYRFEVAAISINWITIIVAGILVSIMTRRKLRELDKERM